MSAGEVAEVIHRVGAWFARSLPHDGVFYAWYDEMSDTLRASAIPGDIGSPLSFRCSVRRHDDPTPIAEATVAEGARGLIPFDELEEIEWTAPDAAVDFTQDVYIVPLKSAALAAGSAGTGEP